MNNPLKVKKRKRRIDSKYRPKYARQLRDGVRKDGISKEELCQEWGVSLSTYSNWTKLIPAFAEADAIGEVDYKAWWAKTYRMSAAGEMNGNAGLLKFAAANVLGWSDKSETKSHHEEEIRIIEIVEMLPNQRIIEHEVQNQIESYAEESTSSIDTKSEEVRQP